jgi:glycosyltransferase involved in cell wall biosynthesis
MVKVDMHCHSRHSDKPIFWLLRKAGARESYCAPEELYRRLKRRGMSFVTITDHDTIAGAQEIAAAHEDAFVSCEFTVRFWQEQVDVHICAYDLTEEQFRRGRYLARDIREFAAYFREQGVLTSVPHPLHDVGGRLEPRHLEQLVLLFEHFEEVNGLQLPEGNQLNREFLAQLTPELVERLATKHGIEPAFPEPWRKGLLGGSDDHSGFFLGRAWTEVPAAEDYGKFLQAIRSRESRGRGLGASALTFAHCALTNTAETMMNHFCDAGPLHQRATQLARLMYGEHIEELELASRMKAHAEGSWQLVDEPTPEEMLIEGLVQIVMRDWHDPNLLFDRVVGRDLQEETFVIVNQLFNTLIRRALTAWYEHLKKGRLMDAFTKLSLVFPTGIVAIPYLMGFQHLHADKGYQRRVAREYGLAEPGAGRAEKWAWFTDTIVDVNGVARTIQTVATLAEQHDTPVTTVTCHPTPPPFQGHLRNFTPIHHMALPEYESMVLSIPPLLEMLRWCEKEQFTRIIISTPGPVGLVALWIAKILDIPTVAIYHTDLPHYARILTDDPSMEALAWHLVRFLYGHVDQVYVLTEAYRRLLQDNGLADKDIRIFPKGTDVTLFHPDRRDLALWKRYGLNGSTKLLYVGRVSREKGLDLLGEAYRRLREERADVELVVVGDGPYLDELKRKWVDVPGVLFTGFVEGEELAALYASSDVFAFPSTTDTYGSVVLEAQAAGLPAVVTDEGGPREVIVEGRTGLVAKASDVEQFTAALRRLVGDRELREEMGYQGRLHAEQKTWAGAFQTFWEAQRGLHHEPRQH